MTLSTKWTSNLNEEETLAFQRRLKGSKKVLERLTVLTKEAYDVSERSIQKRDFTSPAWSEKTAYELGYQKALRAILELIKV